MPKRNGTGVELLADPTRRSMIAILALRPRQPSALAADLGLSRPAITRQLRLLADAGLITGHASVSDRRGVLYTIHPGMHGVITAWLAGTEIDRPTEPFTLPDDLPGDRVVVFGRGVRGLVRRPNRDRSAQAE
jgi:DNA-binding transcriptional ArsR family regulator